mgnify:CR=1 FL=1
MVYTGQGLSYADLRGMDLGEFREAVEAKILFNTEWKPAKAGGSFLALSLSSAASRMLSVMRSRPPAPTSAPASMSAPISRPALSAAPMLSMLCSSRLRVPGHVPAHGG